MGNILSYFFKGPAQSKSMWFNAAVTVLGAITWIQGHDAIILAAAPAAGPIITVIGAVGMVLRVLTEFTPLWTDSAKAPVVEAVRIPVAPQQ